MFPGIPRGPRLSHSPQGFLDEWHLHRVSLPTWQGCLEPCIRRKQSGHHWPKQVPPKPAPTSERMQTVQGLGRTLAAPLMQPLPEQVASALWPTGTFFHNFPVHLKVKGITQPKPNVRRGSLCRLMQIVCQMRSV
jgi:hypothetical protein